MGRRVKSKPKKRVPTVIDGKINKKSDSEPNVKPKVSLERSKVPSNWSKFVDTQKESGSDKQTVEKFPKSLNNQSPRQSETMASTSDVEMPPAVAIDCEMVGIGYKGKESMLARVSIIDERLNVLYDTFVSPEDKVTDYRTFVSGVRPEDMENGLPFKTVREQVQELIDNKILVGHAIKNDLNALLLFHPRRLVRDTVHFPKFKQLAKGRKPSLKNLAKSVLGIDIQSGEHSSVEDARATMRLYLKFKHEFDFPQSHKPVKSAFYGRSPTSGTDGAKDQSH